MTLEIYAGPRVPNLLARAQAELGSNAIVVKVHRSRLPNGIAQFELTAADEASAMALVSGGETRPKESPTDPAPVEQQRKGPRVIALVGPTGSGKTTTISKLALNQTAFGGKKVGLLNLDTHRAGSAEQLAMCSRVARIRMETVSRLKDLRRAMRRLRKCEVILVDTPGRGPARHQDAAAVTEILQELSPHEIHLVLSEGMRDHHAKRIVSEYELRGVTHLLGTKLDEFPGERLVEALANQHGLAVRWLSTGQDIPNDLLTVSERTWTDDATESVTADRGVTAA